MTATTLHEHETTAKGGRTRTVGARVRRVFATRGMHSYPTRPHVAHGHELIRHQVSPLV